MFSVGTGHAQSSAMTIQSFRDLKVWQKSMLLAEQTYSLARGFPAEERYGLARQLRRAAVSIPSNIAEGSAHPTKRYVHHLRIALGSEAELQTQLQLSVRLRLSSDQTATPIVQLASEVGRMLHALIRSLSIPDP